MAKLCKRIGAGILSLVLILTLGLVMVPKQANAISYETLTSVKLIDVKLPSLIEDFDTVDGPYQPSQLQFNADDPMDEEGGEYAHGECTGWVMVEDEAGTDEFDGKKWSKPTKYEVGKEYVVRFMVTTDSDMYKFAESLDSANGYVNGELGVWTYHDYEEAPDDIREGERFLWYKLGTLQEDGTFKKPEASVPETDEVDNGETKPAQEEAKVTDVTSTKAAANFSAAGLQNTDKELLNNVLTKEEQELVASGVPVNVWLESKDITATVSKADKEKVEKALPSTNYAVGAYIDFNLFKQVGDKEATKITKCPNGKVKIGFVIPKALQAEGRAFKIVRLHNEVATLLDVTLGKNYNATFETDEFSTYAIIYTDTNTKSPKTGSNGLDLALLMLAMMSVAGIATLRFTKKDVK